MNLWVAKDRTWSNHWDDPNSEYGWFFGIRMRTACLVIILYTHNTLCIYIYIVINMYIYIYICICIHTYMYPLKISIPVASQSLWFFNALQLTRAPWPSGSFSSNCWIWGGSWEAPLILLEKMSDTLQFHHFLGNIYIYIFHQGFQLGYRISSLISTYIYIYQPLVGLSGKMLLALLNA